MGVRFNLYSKISSEIYVDDIYLILIRAFFSYPVYYEKQNGLQFHSLPIYVIYVIVSVALLFLFYTLLSGYIQYKDMALQRNLWIDLGVFDKFIQTSAN